MSDPPCDNNLYLKITGPPMNTSSCNQFEDLNDELGSLEDATDPPSDSADVPKTILNF